MQQLFDKRCNSQLFELSEKKDYEEELTDLERLWDSIVATPYGANFEVLFALVEAYG